MTVPSKYRATYDKWAPLAVALCLIIASLSSIGTALVYKIQGDEQAARVKQIGGLLGCFDDYAGASAATSKAVRDASVVKDEATTRRDEALQEVFHVIKAASGPDETGRAFADLSVANAALVRAAAALAKVREENPVPDPPSKFCDVQP